MSQQDAIRDQNHVTSILLESSTNSGRTIRATGDETTGRLSVDASGLASYSYAETPTGTVNGSNTVFTLANTPSAQNNVIVFLDGVGQYAGVDYTVSGDEITFTTAPFSGSSIFVYYFTSSGSPEAVGFATRVIAANSATQTITSAIVVLTLDTEVLDSGNDFSANTFTAPATGVYNFSLMTRADSCPANARPNISMRKNAVVQTIAGPDPSGSLSSASFTFNINRMISLTAGDEVDFTVNGNIANSGIIQNTAAVTVLSIFRIA